MKLNKPLFPLLGQLVSRQADSESVQLPEEASPLDFLTAVYRSPQQPIGRRLNAAIAAAPFMHAKLTVNATMDNESFAKQMWRHDEAVKAQLRDRCHVQLHSAEAGVMQDLSRRAGNANHSALHVGHDQ